MNKTVDSCSLGGDVKSFINCKIFLWLDYPEKSIYSIFFNLGDKNGAADLKYFGGLCPVSTGFGQGTLD